MTLSDLNTSNLTDAVSFLREENASLKEERTLLKQKCTLLQEQLEWLKKQIFGPRSERVKPLNEGQLEFEGFDAIKGALEEEQEEEVEVTQRRKKKKLNRNGKDKITIPDDLPVKTTILDLKESEKICPETGEPLIKIGEEKTYKLAQTPVSYYVREIIRPKYAHQTQKETGIKIADLPDSIIPKCRADESLLAEIAVQKFGDHLPLYRIAQIMERSGIHINRQILSQWMVKIGLSLEILHQEMLKKILHSGQVFIDETPVDLQAKSKCKTSYLWVMVGGKKDLDPPYKIYHFRETREHKHGIELLQNYKGVIHSDKYGAYEKIAKKEDIEWAPCWGHVRRKFFDIPGSSSFKSYVLRKIKYLFLFERIAWKRSPEERLTIRTQKEQPIIDELIRATKKQLEKGKILPKSRLGKAINYFLGLQGYLKTYLSNPYAQISNNVAERAIRPVAIGRKNWLFFGSKHGGKAGAIFLSLIQTCKTLKINPRVYLEDIFRRIMSHPAKKNSRATSRSMAANPEKTRIAFHLSAPLLKKSPPFLLPSAFRPIPSYCFQQ